MTDNPNNEKRETSEVFSISTYPTNMDTEEKREYQIEKRQYVMCPTVGCREKLIGSWKDHETGDIKNGLKVYKCPGCGNEFTINDFKINAVPIPNKDGVAVVYNTTLYKVIFKAPGRFRFIDSDDIAYVHIPLSFLSGLHTALVYLTDIEPEDFTDDEIIEAIKKYEAEKERNAPKRLGRGGR